jgi:pilus assembly protein Flp/PilA
MTSLRKAWLGVSFALCELWANEEAQGLVEYSLILLLVSIVSIAILTILGTDVRNVFSSIINSF